MILSLFNYVINNKYFFFYRWVNSGYSESCLDLAEELANQTPVRLDVLLSLTPSAVTSDQLVVPGSVEDSKPADRVARSHSVGSICGRHTEAERRILDMVAAGGEAALAPSPTRTITPAESPAQPKRKLETTISTDNAIGIIMKKDKMTAQSEPNELTICEKMEIDLLPESAVLIEPTEEQLIDTSPPIEIARDATIQITDKNCMEELTNKISVETPKESSPEKKKIIKKKIVKSTPTGDSSSITTDEKKKSPTKTVRKVVAKTKSPPDSGNIVLTPIEKPTFMPEQPLTPPIENEEKIISEPKTAQQSDDVKAQPERRKSRIFEAAEKFQSMSASNNDKVKKIVIPGISVGNFKKEFERKASLTSQTSISSIEKKMLEKRGSDSSNEQQPCDSRKSSICDTESIVTPNTEDDKTLNQDLDQSATANTLNESESKSSITSFSLEEARRSMENSIALLNQAKTESNTDLDNLCQKTENVAVSDENAERLKKLKNAREIIGNAIPVGRLG